MRFNKFLLLVVLIFNASLSCFSQNEDVLFSYDEYIENILKYHPIAKKIDLKSKFAKAEMQLAKGFFDPKLNSTFKEKDFHDVIYYKRFNNKLIIPTPLGIDVVADYTKANGYYLNPENKTDYNGVWGLGLEANILQGLLVNKRKTALEKARIFQKSTKNEQDILFNELLYEASKSYLNWLKYNAYTEALTENKNIANTYFKNTKLLLENGEKTVIDTLEASISHKETLLKLQKNKALLIKAQQEVSNFLWYKDSFIALKPNTRPLDFDLDISNINNDIHLNPSIKLYNNKLAYYEAEQRLKKDKLKPKLKLKYKPLLSTSYNSLSPNFNIDDFKWSVDFSMPLFLRKERAQLKMSSLKLESVQYEIENKTNELQNKITASLEKQMVLRKQVVLLSQNINGYKLLLDGENEKFKYGESSVFLLNKRQEKYITSKLKLIDLKIKLKTEKLTYLFYTNSLIKK